MTTATRIIKEKRPYEIREILARKRIEYFTQYTKKDYQMNWHHQYLCHKLDQLVNGEITRLMVFMPPRHGKSELTSRRLPAFALGRNPNEKIIATSYGSDLASAMNRDVQRIMDKSKYRHVFPYTCIPKAKQSIYGQRYVRNNEMFEIVDREGVYKSAGIGGAITGLGFTLGIIDDPIKNRKEADSQAFRDSLWDWYTSTFYTRCEKGARILITLTRWHEDDLAGRLLKKAKEDPQADQWEVIRFPALRDDVVSAGDVRELGEPLWPDKYSLTALQAIRANAGGREWASLYQQTPVTDGGNIVKREWWRFYKPHELPLKFDEVIQSWDLTFKETGTSFVVGQTWGRVNTKKYLLDQIRAKMGFTDTVRSIKTMSVKFDQTSRIYIEDKANGPAVIESLKSQISGIVPVSPDGTKEARAHAVSAQIEAGEVFLPELAPWVHDYIMEWAQFPNGENDDQVDATTQALSKLNNSSIRRLEQLLRM